MMNTLFKSSPPMDLLSLISTRHEDPVVRDGDFEKADDDLVFSNGEFGGGEQVVG